MPDALLPAAKAYPKGAYVLRICFFLLASAKQGLGLRDSKIFGGDSGAVQGRLEFPAPSLTKPEPATQNQSSEGIQLPVV